VSQFALNSSGVFHDNPNQTGNRPACAAQACARPVFSDKPEHDRAQAMPALLSRFGQQTR